MTEIENDFPRNLALLCSYAPSIAEVCRRLGMNRAQFNRYLAGSAMPSRRSLRRICDHFGVTEWELQLPHARFAEIVALKPKASGATEGASLPGYPARVQANAQPLHERYHGYYFRYFYSATFPNAIIRSLVRIAPHEGRVLWKNVERVQREGPGHPIIDTLKYLGEVLHLAERIHVFEHETILGHNLCYIILYPNYRNNLPWLTGLQTWVSLGPGRLPVAASVTLEALGRQIDLRKALAACGAFRADSAEIDPGVRERLVAVSRPRDHAFAAAELQ